MLVEYNKIYQPASGVTHGEWWAIEDNVMERCMNPLHRFHLCKSYALTTVSPSPSTSMRLVTRSAVMVRPFPSRTTTRS